VQVVGEFGPFWDFAQDFADYLIIEDSTRENDTFYKRHLQGKTVIKKLDNFNVVVWRTSTEALRTESNDSERYYGFRHLLSSPIGTQLYQTLAQDVMEQFWSVLCFGQLS
jgi:hypothetical protein